ncbi:peptidoglycan-binding domain-containing protein [Streptomyces sp. NPDC001941]|uniref:peptidoglycan-binding domain-containing protein n=1 Tax=Streptomyces sp. NPDC001941 TaxID=3154659 RepID=UPI003322D3A4
MRRPAGKFAAAAAVVLVAAGGATALALRDDADPTPASARAQARPTDRITRGDLQQKTSFQGVLGFADRRDLKAARGGTLTAQPPAAGTTVRLGRPLYEIDRVPTVLLYGKVPMYRDLAQGAKGIDVSQLQHGLRSLGYHVTASGTYDDATTSAVRKWQKQLGAPATGTLTAGQVVFLPDAVRIAEVKALTGDRIEAAGPVLTLSGRTRVVTAQVKNDVRQLLKRGRKVTLTPPDGKPAQGTVTAVGPPAAPAPQAGAPSDGQDTPGAGKSPVTIEVPARSGIGDGDDQVPVTVSVTAESARDVLTVPVEALLALREGGKGLEIVTDTGTRTVAVTTGMYADGRVQVTGEGLREGMRIGVPPK